MRSTMDDAGELDRHLTGYYANYCRMGHNLIEFVLDFGHRYAEDGTPVYHTRIVTTPTYMAEFLVAMNAAMAEYRSAAAAVHRQDD